MSALVPAVGLVMALVLGAAGAVALVTGRVVLPWFRGSVGRPGLWGAGALLLAGGLAAGRLMPFGGNMPLVLGGLVLVAVSQFLEPPRARPAARQRARRDGGRGSRAACATSPVEDVQPGVRGAAPRRCSQAVRRGRPPRSPGRR
ncbi:hypothetical protein SUDANB176_05885 [Streptomyces sp. enrichment culture]|uniref:hypothetical protein n=1 Tax=Streptomyces sp. enrichment culture TaxID=1795815 RepID=UPI003F562780